MNNTLSQISIVPQQPSQQQSQSIALNIKNNAITLPPNASLSTQFGVETRNTVLNAISTMLDNLQQELLTYNKAFAVPMESMTKSIQNYSTLQQIQNISSTHLWKSLNNDIANCILLNDQMWKEILNHKTKMMHELTNIHQAIQQLHQQKIVLIDTPSNFALNTNNNNNNNQHIINNLNIANISNISNAQNRNNNQTKSQSQFPQFPKIQNIATGTTIQNICIQDINHPISSNQFNGNLIHNANPIINNVQNQILAMPPLSADNNNDENKCNENIINGQVYNSELHGHINLNNRHKNSNGHINITNTVNKINVSDNGINNDNNHQNRPQNQHITTSKNGNGNGNVPSGFKQLFLRNDNSNSTHSTLSNPTNPSSSSKRKRKRRGYNGPYSEEEQNFMRNWPKNQTPQDILNMSNAMENRFKVKRSPYGLAQKMYQMGIINSRLKAIFQVRKNIKSEREIHIRRYCVT